MGFLIVIQIWTISFLFMSCENHKAETSDVTFQILQIFNMQPKTDDKIYTDFLAFFQDSSGTTFKLFE